MDCAKRIRRRSLLIGVIITIIFFLLLINTFLIQTINATRYREQAANNWNNSYVLEPERGTIYDRNATRLGHNIHAYTVIAILAKNNPARITDPVSVAQQLSPILNMTEGSIISLLTRDAYQVEIRPGGWKITKEQADQIRELKIPGIVLREENKRYYPFDTFASHTIGFVNYDNQAVMGLENYYDDYLRGKQGQLNVQEDLKGYSLPAGEILFEPAVNGNHLVTTFDNTIQQYIEQALDNAQELYNPKNMIAIVADPNTGEILGQATRPNFDLNKYWDIADYNDLTINYNFEPGSTFKIFTLAAAIEEGLFKPNDTFMSGKIEVPGGVIQDPNNGVGWGEITYLEGTYRSSNVAFVKLGYEMLSTEQLFSYIDDFGFGHKTGIDLKNEATGMVKGESQRYPLDVATTTFGQGIAVTPMQMVKATSILANGGYSVTPHLATGIKDANTGELIETFNYDSQERIISEKTARQVSSILEESVNFGNKAGYIEGYNVAGKTGTAQKVGKDGNYLSGAYIASFIGYAPSHAPELLVYVIVDEPQVGTAYYGSTIAAPIFTEIMQNSLRYMKVPVNKTNNNSVNKNENAIQLKDYSGEAVANASSKIAGAGLKPIVIGDGDKIIRQYPLVGSTVAKGSNFYLITVPENQYVIADLTGMSLREALEYCMVLNIDCTFHGSGYVVSQSLSYGNTYNGGKMVLFLEDASKTIKEEQVNINNED